jgi:hypothetical protein
MASARKTPSILLRARKPVWITTARGLYCIYTFLLHTHCVLYIILWHYFPFFRVSHLFNESTRQIRYAAYQFGPGHGEIGPEHTRVQFQQPFAQAKIHSAPEPFADILRVRVRAASRTGCHIAA